MYSFGATSLARLIELVEKPRRAGTGQRCDDMGLPLFDNERHVVSAGAKFGGLLTHLIGPTRIQLAREHVNAHLAEGIDLPWCCIVEKSGKAGDRPEILRIFSGHKKRAQAAVRVARDVKLVVRNLVVAEQLRQKSWKYALAAFEEEISIWRGGFHDNVS